MSAVLAPETKQALENISTQLQQILQKQEEVAKSYTQRPKTTLEEIVGVEQAYYDKREEPPMPASGSGGYKKLAFDFANLVVQSLNRRKFTKPLFFRNADPEDFEIFVREALLEILYDTIPSELPGLEVEDYVFDTSSDINMFGISFETNIGKIMLVVIGSSYGDNWQLIDFAYEPSERAKEIEPKETAVRETKEIEDPTLENIDEELLSKAPMLKPDPQEPVVVEQPQPDAGGLPK
jgi:hypothetical protein